MKTTVAAATMAGALLMLVAPSASGGVIYDNTTTTVFNAFGTVDSTIQTFGDYVTFSGGSATIGSVSFLVDVSQNDGTPVANFGLFVYDDNAGTVGSLLSSATLNDYGFAGNGEFTLSFSGLNIPVGPAAFIGLSIENYDADGTFNDFIGVMMYDPPTTGASDAETMLFASGAGFTPGQSPQLTLGNANQGLNNIAMTIAAVPEPQALAAVSGLGLAGFALARWRRARLAATETPSAI